MTACPCMPRRDCGLVLAAWLLCGRYRSDGMASSSRRGRHRRVLAQPKNASGKTRTLAAVSGRVWFLRQRPAPSGARADCLLRLVLLVDRSDCVVVDDDPDTAFERLEQL